MPEDRLSPQQTWAMFAAVLGMVGLLVAAVFLPPVITPLAGQRMGLTMGCLALAFGCAVAVDKILDGAVNLLGRPVLLAGAFLVLSLIGASGP